MTLDEIIEFFQTLSQSSYSNPEHGLICQGYMTFLAVTFKDNYEPGWLTKKKTDLLTQLNNLQNDKTLIFDINLIQQIHKDITWGGISLKSMLSAAGKSPQEFIGQLKNVIPSDEILEPDEHKQSDIELELDDLATKAIAFNEFSEAVEAFALLLKKASEMAIIADTELRSYLFRALSKIIFLVERVPRQLTEETIAAFKYIIKSARDHAIWDAGDILCQQLRELQKTVALILYKQNFDAEINIRNLLIAHQLMLRQIAFTNALEDTQLLYKIHVKLYKNLNFLVTHETAIEKALHWLNQTYAANNQIIQSPTQEWATLQRSYITQMNACIQIIAPKLPVAARITLFEIPLDALNTIPLSLTIATDYTHKIFCIEALAETHYFIGTHNFGTKNFEDAIFHSKRTDILLSLISQGSDKAKLLLKANLYSLVMSLLMAGIYNPSISEGIIQINIAIKENKRLSYLFPADDANYVTHQSVFANLLYVHANILFNEIKTAKQGLYLFKVAAREIHKIPCGANNPTIAQQKIRYSHKRLEAAAHVCARFTDKELMILSNLDFLLKTHNELKTTPCIDLTPQLNNAVLLNKRKLSNYLERFKQLAPTMTFVSQLAANVNEYKTIWSYIQKIYMTDTLESLRVFHQFIIDFLKTHPASPYAALLVKTNIALNNFIFLQEPLVNPIHQLRISA